ncbi:unnamed protein product [Protopolystoma xenopodis]|uniref:Uncharacterized protein n=1 Tax=Protopolystoma xenopodis TaxID=117903 RepID=A0A3S5FGM2_9PLAT|nr:unnamed protein product [Protopolystoma xenopodis]
MVERELVNLRVTPVSPERPPARFIALNVGRKLPVVTVTEVASLTGHVTTMAFAEEGDFSLSEDDQQPEHVTNGWETRRAVTVKEGAKSEAVGNEAKKLSAFGEMSSESDSEAAVEVEEDREDDEEGNGNPNHSPLLIANSDDEIEALLERWDVQGLTTCSNSLRKDI